VVTGNIEINTPPYAYTITHKEKLTVVIKPIPISSLPNIYPSFLMKRFGNVVSEKQMGRLLKKWDLFTGMGAIPSNRTHSSRSKSNKPAYHFGVWRRYSEDPFITKDSNCSDTLKLDAANQFLNLIRKHVASKIADYTKMYSSELWEYQKQ
jgi:hypothetical protein